MTEEIETEKFNFEFDSQNPIKNQSKIADVYFGKSANDKIIIKRLKKYAVENPQYLQKIQIENQINKIYFDSIHCHIITTENHTYINRPYIEGQQLDIFFQNLKVKKSEKIKILIHIWIKTLVELEKLHTHEIIHRDLKPANIIISTNEDINLSTFESIKVTLIDFGQSNFVKDQHLEHRIPFSLIYSPPEQVLNFHELCSYQSDFYALGMSIYEIITGEKPFKHYNPEILMNLMVSLPLDFSQIKPKIIQKIFEKSCFKRSLGKPPSHFSKSELKNFIHSDISNRYSSCSQINSDLMKIESGINKKNHLISKLKSLFS